MSEHVHYISDDSFEQEVLQAGVPVLVWITGRTGAAPAR